MGAETGTLAVGQGGESPARGRGVQVALAGSMIVAVSYGWGRYNYGLFLPEIQAAFALTPAWLGAIGSLSYSGYLLATLFASLLAARLGPRVLIALGGGCASLGLLLVSQAQGPLALLLGLVVAGVSPGLCYAPLSDVVVRTYARADQGRAYAFINTGTGFGVVLAGPLALWMGAQWRDAWLLFAGLSLLITWWNWRLMPGREAGAAPVAAAALPPLRWLFSARHAWLYAFAFLVGLSCSVYWTFAVEWVAVSTAGGGGQGLSAPHGTRVFWVVLGVAGCAGVIAGDLVRRVGLIAALRVFALLLGASLWLLALGAHRADASLASAALFGSAFVVLTGLIGIWAVHSFHQRPSAGFGMVFLVISLGQFVGPFAAGLLAEAAGLRLTFAAAGTAVAALVWLMPATNVWSLTPPAPE